MLEGCFNPEKAVAVEGSIDLKLTVISGRHLHKSIKHTSACNPHVKVEILGCPVDCCVGTTAVVQVLFDKAPEYHVKARHIQGNGFNPSWNEAFDFGTVFYPSLAVMRIAVYSKNDLLGVATYPLALVRTGYRLINTTQYPHGSIIDDSFL